MTSGLAGEILDAAGGGVFRGTYVVLDNLWQHLSALLQKHRRIPWEL
jgi:hypothetical protein